MMIYKSWWKLFASILLLFSLFTGTAFAAGLQDFALITEQEGWVLLNQHVYWTTTAGNTWIDITPPNLEQAIIWAVRFTDVQHGWLVFTDADELGNPIYGVARTTNGGVT